MTTTEQLSPERAEEGDWLIAAFPGGTQRRGQILEVLVTPERTQFRVRWSRDHETVLYPDMRRIRVLPGPQRQRD